MKGSNELLQQNGEPGEDGSCIDYSISLVDPFDVYEFVESWQVWSSLDTTTLR